MTNKHNDKAGAVKLRKVFKGIYLFKEYTIANRWFEDKELPWVIYYQSFFDGEITMRFESLKDARNWLTNNVEKGE